MPLSYKCLFFLCCAILPSFSAAGALPFQATQMEASQVTSSSSSKLVTASVSSPAPSPAAAAPAAQQISPKTVYVHLGQSQQFVSAGATSWNVSVGTLTKSGYFTAPATMPKYQTILLSAKGPGGVASATVTMVSGDYQTISPQSVTVGVGTQKQFTSPDATVWQAVNGTISTTGLYSAPKVWPPSGQDTITVYGKHGCVKTTITIKSQIPTITGVGTGGPLPLGVFTVTVRGTNFSSGTTASILGTPMITNFTNGVLSITSFFGTPGLATLTVANGAVASVPFPVQIGQANTKVDNATARRFLQHAAFGPSTGDVAAVQTLGLQGWLNQQLSMAPTSTYKNITASLGGLPNHFYTDAVNQPDQLRQRVAFSLSQIFVTSLERLISNPKMIMYQDMLLNDAFTNYRTIMNDVTLSPAMGQYLDMGNNDEANPTTGAVANENYARELMQLFTLGTNLLNADGSTQVDSNGLPLPTYTQSDITEFARAYTGWTYTPPPGQPVVWNRSVTTYGPMVPFPSHHDSGSKQLLNGFVSPAGATPQQDLKNALDNIFNHPNMPPFVSRMLIQHLVKSNPSPAYITRVAAVFKNNGSGVRGDMKAILTAILMDPEARANDEGQDDLATDGHMQEPALFFPAIIREMGGTMTDNNQYYYDVANEGEEIYHSPSVFNYFSPNAGVPGTNLKGPEFQIFTPNNAIMRSNLVATLFDEPTSAIQSYGKGTTVDLSAYLPLASNPAMLVDALDFIFTRGVMPAEMKSIIETAVAGENGGSLRRVQRACFLILTSNYYNVWH